MASGRILAPVPEWQEQERREAQLMPVEEENERVAERVADPPRPDQRAEREASSEQRPFEAPAAPDEIQAVDLSLGKERRLLPSKAVQDLHKLTHLPPAEWCTICVRSRARDDCHHRQPEAERKTTPVDEFPVLQADHTTLGDQKVLSIVHTDIKGGAAQWC